MIESVLWCMRHIGNHFVGWQFRYINGGGTFPATYIFEFDDKANYDMFNTEFSLRFG